MTIKRMTKQYKTILRINMSSLEFISKKINETRKYILEKINHNDLLSEKNEKTCKYLNYVEHLLF